MSMLLEHFGLRRDPFETEPDPRTFHPTRAHAAALGAVGDAVRTGKPLTVLEGPDGAGKTMLLRCLAAELPERFQLAVVERDARRQGSLCTAIAGTLGLDGVSRDRECREAVLRYLEHRAAQGYRTALAVDDAHTLPDHWVEELDMITADEVLPVVLACAGQPAGTSGLPAAARLRERVVETVRLDRIAPSECSGYLQALLMSAGAREPRLFDAAAVGTLHELSHGLPGRLSSLGSRSLMVAYGRGRDGIDQEAVLQAAEQLAAGHPVRKLHAVASPEPPAREPAAIPVARPEVVEPQLAAVAGGDTHEFPVPSRWATAGPVAQGPSVGEPAGGSVVGSSRPPLVAGAAPATAGAPGAPVGGGLHPPAGYPDAATRKQILAGIRRPDRPAWDRAKTDPFRDATPEAPPFGPDMLPVLSDPHGPVTEWFRMVRLGLEEWIEARGGQCQSVLVSSAEAGAGKTFVAVNLALLCAQEPSCRVLLVDGDMRRPRFESLFGTPGRPGLADVLAGRSTLEESVQYISEVGLYVLPAGRAGNPRDLVSPERLEPALAEMKRDADLVILDAPPIQAWVDSRSMAAATDGVLFVIRAGRTRAQALTRSMGAVEPSRLIGAVVTDVDAERTHGDRRPRR